MKKEHGIVAGMAFVALALISWIVSSALAPDSVLPCNFLYGGISALANIQERIDYNFYPMYGEKYGPFGKEDSAFLFESVGWIEKSSEDFQLVLGGYIPYEEQGAGSKVDEFWQKKERGEDVIAEVDEVRNCQEITFYIACLFLRERHSKISYIARYVPDF